MSEDAIPCGPPAEDPKKKGTRIPGGKGKCTRPEGHCRPSKVRQ